MPARRERRRHARFVVENLSVTLAGTPLSIVDISSEAVRLTRPAELPPLPAPLVFTERDGDRETSYRSDGHLVRQTASCVVLRYAAPAPNWADILRRHDSLARTALDESVFG